MAAAFEVMKQKIKYIIFAGLLGLFIGFLYNHITIPDSSKREFSYYKHSVRVRNSNYVEMAFPILYKETYSLKISSPEDKKKKIVVNNSILIPWKTKFYRKKHSKPVDYILIPSEKLNIGKNCLKIYFSSNISTWVTMRLKNYRGNSGNRIFVLFKDSHILPLKRNPITCMYSVLIILSIFLFLLWRAGEHIYSKFVVSLLPANILFLLAYIIPKTFDMRLFVTSGYFWTLQAISSALICSVFFYSYNKKIINKIVRLHLRRIEVFCQWLISFSDKCIVLFIFLFIVCALLLIAHLEIAAERVANVAYFALCLGVVIKFVQLVKSGKGEGEGKDEG